MDPAVLDRLLALVAKTRERHVLVDATLPEPIVVLPLTSYERLVGGTNPESSRPAAQMPRPARPGQAPEEDLPWTIPTMPISQENEGNSPTIGEAASAEEDRFYLEPIE